MNHNGWIRIIALVIPYFVIEIIFYFIGYSIAQVPLDNPDYELQTWQQVFVTFSSFLGTTFVIWLFMKYIDKEKFIQLGLHLKNRLPDIWVGIGIGFFVMLLAYSGLSLSNQITFDTLTFNVLELIYVTLIFVFVAILEEILFRGYILKNLMLSFNKYVALIISSILFALMHGFNPNISMFSLFGLFTAGLALGITYIYTKNLWFPIAFHFSWNYFQSLFGFNVSGQDIYSIIEFKIPVANKINGGLFGFEGSIFSLLTEIVLVGAIFLYYTKKQKTNSILNENI